MLDPVARDRPRIRPQRPNCEDAHPVHEVEFDDPTTIHSRLGESELPEVHQAAVDLLELLKKNLPDKCGEASGWNFEKAHSILRKVRVGVRVVQGYCERTMLSMEDAQAQFSQNEPSGDPKLYLIKHIHCRISWDIPV